MADQNQLPDWRDEKALADWLALFPQPLITAFGFKMALLRLAGLWRITGRLLEKDQTPKLVLMTFRSIAAALVAARYPSTRSAAAASAAVLSRDAAVRHEQYADTDYAGAAAVAGSNVPNGAAAVVSIAKGLSWVSAPQINAMMRDLVASRQHEDPSDWYLSQAFHEDAERLKNLSRWFDQFSIEDGWDIWREWLLARFQGDSDWPKAAYDELAEWRKEWDRPPGDVNRDIAALLAKHEPKAAIPTAASTNEIAYNWDFFLSYSNKDEAAAKAIDDILRAAGYRVFFQLRNMDTGASYIQRMKQGLKASRRLIAVMSPDYEDSPHCQNEWGAFYDKDPSFNQRLMVHLVVRGPITDRIARQSVYVSVEKLSGGDLAKAVLRAIEHKHT